MLNDSRDMNSFAEQLGRLKATLGVTEDQEVAAALGLSRAAFSERKRRGSFPVDKLKLLASAKPEVGIDVDYVLSGAHTGGDRTAAVEEVRSRRGAFAPALDTPYLLKVLERVNELADERGMQLDAAALGAIAGGVYNILPVGAPLNDALIYAMLELHASGKD
jgi:hypothetical protein